MPPTQDRLRQGAQIAVEEVGDGGVRHNWVSALRLVTAAAHDDKLASEQARELLAPRQWRYRVFV
ncbi:MAG: hypothetical protein QOG52_2138, partial [Frankiaceae bacterium]|nr:hypothetical protein [Frankiaceae bacterium]